MPSAQLKAKTRDRTNEGIRGIREKESTEGLQASTKGLKTVRWPATSNHPRVRRKLTFPAAFKGRRGRRKDDDEAEVEDEESQDEEIGL